MNRALPRATVRSAVYLAFALCMITTAVNLQAPLYDALAARFTELKVKRDPACRYCGDDVLEFPGYVDYDAFCSADA